MVMLDKTARKKIKWINNRKGAINVYGKIIKRFLNDYKTNTLNKIFRILPSIA